jgi:AraC-like DNA-binding protein
MGLLHPYRRQSGLSRYPQFETNDPDEYRAVFSRAARNFRLSPLSRTPPYYLSSHMAQLKLLAISNVWLGYPREVWTEADNRFYIVGLWRQGGNEYTCNGHRFTTGPGEGMLFVPDAESYAKSSGDQEAVLLRIPRETLLRVAQHLVGKPSNRPLEATGMIHVQSPLWRIVDFLISELDLEEGMFTTSPLAAQELEHALIRTVIESTPNSYWPPPEEKRHNTAFWHVRRVRRAEAYMEAHLCESIGLSDLCHAAGANSQALRGSFHAVHQASPMVILRNMRLDRARRELEKPRPETTVASVAFVYRFGHRGWFAKFYQQQFLEHPSETLRRGQRRAGMVVLSAK